MPKTTAASLCVRCKGYRRLCRLDTCPILERTRSHFRVYYHIKSESVDGSTPPSLLVGEYGYPKVRVMLNIPPAIYGDEARIYDDPLMWWGRYSLDDIIRFRSRLLASVVRLDIHNPWKLYEKEINISAVSLEPVDSEARLRKKPRPHLRFNAFTKPVGLLAEAEDIKVTSTPRIGWLLEKRIHDDVKAADVVVELYEGGYDIYTLIHALSGGLLGSFRNRKIVPTRWAITAVDSILGSYFRRRLRKSPYISDTLAFSGEYLENKFLVILTPGPLELEWIEAWHPRSLWGYKSKRPSISVLTEDVRGRYEYMDGGYMAARLSVLEYLSNINRQATVFIYREIKPTYYAPVGNWHIRETVKRMLRREPRKYSTLEEAFKHELKFFDIPASIWLSSSKLLRDIRGRRSIMDFIRRE